MKNTKHSINFLVGVVLMMAIISSGCFVRLEVLSQKLNTTVLKAADGESDYAVKYTVLVRNKGIAGNIRAKAKLYTSEGQFYKERIIHLEADEEKTLEFIFPEVTVLGELFGEGKTQSKFEYENVK